MGSTPMADGAEVHETHARQDRQSLSPVVESDSSEDLNGRFVELVFVAFALSAVIYQVTPSDSAILWAVALVLVGSGLLLASFQLSIGALRGDSRWARSLRAGLTFVGVVAVTVAVGILVTPSDGAPWQVTAGLVVLGLGVVVPMVVRMVKTGS